LKIGVKVLEIGFTIITDSGIGNGFHVIFSINTRVKSLSLSWFFSINLSRNCSFNFNFSLGLRFINCWFSFEKMIFKLSSKYFRCFRRFNSLSFIRFSLTFFNLIINLLRSILFFSLNVIFNWVHSILSFSFNINWGLLLISFFNFISNFRCSSLFFFLFNLILFRWEIEFIFGWESFFEIRNHFDWFEFIRFS